MLFPINDFDIISPIHFQVRLFDTTFVNLNKVFGKKTTSWNIQEKTQILSSAKINKCGSAY